MGREMRRKKKCLEWDDQDRKENVLWLLDRYNLPVYKPDEGLPIKLQTWFQRWTELISYCTVMACLIVFITTFCISPWIAVTLNCPPKYLNQNNSAIISEYTVKFGLWKRCFNSPMGMKIEKPENGSDQIITLENPPVCLNSWELDWTDNDTQIEKTKTLLECFFSNDDFQKPSSSVVKLEVKIARNFIGVGIGFICTGQILVFLNVINRNSIWNISALFNCIGMMFISIGTMTVCFIPNQNKFLINLPTYRPIPSPTTTTTTTTTKSPWWPSDLVHENKAFELGYWSLISNDNIHFKPALLFNISSIFISAIAIFVGYTRVYHMPY